MAGQECIVGYYALTISILKNWTPEMAWAYLTDAKPNKTITDHDIEDMIELKKTMTYGEVGELYGISKDSVYNRIRRYKGLV